MLSRQLVYTSSWKHQPRLHYSCKGIRPFCPFARKILSMAISLVPSYLQSVTPVAFRESLVSPVLSNFAIICKDSCHIGEGRMLKPPYAPAQLREDSPSTPITSQPPPRCQPPVLSPQLSILSPTAPMTVPTHRITALYLLYLSHSPSNSLVLYFSSVHLLQCSFLLYRRATWSPTSPLPASFSVRIARAPLM